MSPRQVRYGAKVSISMLSLALLPAIAAQPAAARGGDTVYEITEPMTHEQRADYADIIRRFAGDIPNEKIKVRDHFGSWIFIRLEDERSCWEEACLTIVQSKCGRPDCPSATVIAAPRYKVSFTGTRFGSAIFFIKRS